VLLGGSVAESADLLQKSYLFAVLSIRTELNQHERAFTAFYANGGDTETVGETSGEVVRTLEDAALETIYGGNKLWWIRDTFDAADWEAFARAVRSHVENERWETLLETVVENFKGVSYRKGAFMLALSGLHEFGCIDSHVADYTGFEESKGNSLTFTSATDYLDTCDEIFGAIPSEWPKFVKQWAIYDYERGEHAPHRAFYAELPIRMDR
jgi:hypothetical protein